jgi:lantibiotic modifying enzyme
MQRGTGPSNRSDAAVDPGEALDASRAIADHLEELAIHHEEERSWIGLSMIRENEWSIHPLGPDLYDGLTGIGLYFAYLGEVTNEMRYGDIARSVVKVIQRQIL